MIVIIMIELAEYLDALLLDFNVRLGIRLRLLTILNPDRPRGLSAQSPAYLDDETRLHLLYKLEDEIELYYCWEDD